MEIVRGGSEQMGRGRKRFLLDGGFHQESTARSELHGLCSAVVHLCQDGPARRTGAADGVTCSGGTTCAFDDIQDQRGHPQGTGQSSAPLSRRTTVEDVLWYTGPLRP